MKRILSMMLVIAMIFMLLPSITLTAFAAETTPVYDSWNNRIEGMTTPLYIEAGTSGGTAVYYMNGTTKTYVNPNAASGDDLSGFTIFGGVYSGADTYADIKTGSITMTGGNVGTIVSGNFNDQFCKSSYLEITGGSVGKIFIESVYNPNPQYINNVTAYITISSTLQFAQTLKNGVYKSGTDWVVAGNAVTPESLEITVDTGETMTVDSGETLTNNGTIINKGTITLNGPALGNAIRNDGGTIIYNAAYIEDITSVSSVSAKINAEDYSVNGRWLLAEGRLYLWLPSGNAEVTLNGTKYYGVTSVGNQTELTAAYTGANGISGMPVEMVANTEINLSATAEPKDGMTFQPTVSYELVSDGTTAQGVIFNGTSLYAASDGIVRIKVTATDGYTSYSEIFDISVILNPVIGFNGDVPSAVVINQKVTLPAAFPTNASYRNITWTVVNGTATISDGVFTAPHTGTVKIRATIENGLSYGSAYTQEFTLNVSSITGNTVDISEGDILISKENDSQLRVTAAGYEGGHKLISNSDILVITGKASETYRVLVETDVTANIELNNCSISYFSNYGSGEIISATPFSIAPGAKVNLTLVGDNELTAISTTFGRERRNAGLYVPSGAEIIISGDGNLTATGGAGSAGIGGGNDNCGTITINGGTVTASSSNGAGIGGGSNGSGGTITINGGTVIATTEHPGAAIGGGYMGSAGTITINGGTVTATASDYGAAIGGGYMGSTGTITINGGAVTATAERTGAAIGGGREGSGGTITINGGTVIATSTYNNYGGAAIGSGYKGSGGTVVITGGNIKASSSSSDAIGNGIEGSGVTVQNGDGSNVTLNVLTLEGITEQASVAEVADVSYGLKDVYTLDSNKLYFYFPANTAASSITAGGEEYICHSSNLTYYTEHKFMCEVAKNCFYCDYIGGEHNFVNGICTCGIGDDGAYYISTPKQLMDFAILVNEGDKSANATLMADIDLTGYEWTTICETGLYYSDYGTDLGYSGTFDGNGHIIRNIAVKSSATRDASCGLFGTVSGTIKNLGVEGFTFVDGGKDIRAGAIVGQLITENGKVSNCYVKGANITPGEHVTGGIAGCVYDGTIENCYVVESTITGSSGRFGHIVGDSRGDGGASDRPGTVTNCYSDNATLRSNNAGNVTNCETKSKKAFASGEITYLLNGSKSDGDLIWYQTLGTDSVPKFAGSTVYKVTCEGVDCYSNENKNYDTHNFVDDICSRCGKLAPAVNNNGIYEISTAAQYLWFAEFVNAGNTGANAKLMADIDLSEHGNVMIGTSSAKYSGSFDGNGKKLTVNFNTTEEYTAPFRYINGATIKNLTVDGTIATSAKFAAGMVGYSDGSGKIEKCMVGVTINSGVSGDGTHGGIVANISSGSMDIDNCGFIGSIAGESTHSCGGFVGWTNGKANIKNSYMCGTFVTGTSECYTFGRNPNNITISDSYYKETYGTDNSGATQKSAEQFASGEVTYLLNGSKSDGELVWYQTIGTDAYPQFTGSVVYYDSTNGYNNHVHSWKYDLDGADTIKATCTADGCPDTDVKTIVISASGKEYDGEAVTATVMNNVDSTDYSVSIVYEAKTGSLTEGKAVNAGEYTAKITVGGVTASVDFEITPKSLSGAAVTIDNNANLVYTGGEITPDVTVALDGKILTTDDYTVSYSDNTNAGQATVTVMGKGNYKDTASTSFTITKATPVVTAPTAKTGLTYTGQAQTLINTGSTTGGTMQYSLDNVTYSAYIPTATNAGTHMVYYKVAGGNNYNDVAASSIEVIIGKQTVNKPTVSSKAYTGTELTADIPASELYTVSQESKTDVGEYDVILTLTDTANCKWADTEDASVTLKFNITAATNSWKTEPSISGWTFGQTASTPSYEAKFGNGNVKVEYKKAEDSAYTATVPTNAGNYTARFSVAATDNYGALEKTVDFTIAKAQAVISVESSVVKTYGETWELPTATTNFGTVTVDKTVADMKNAGSYTVTYTVVGDDSFNGAAKQVSVTINPKNIAGAEITLGDALTYNKAEQTQTVSGVTIDGLDVTYDISGNSATNAGDYTLTITANGNFAGEATKGWSIAKATPDEIVFPEVSAITYGEKLSDSVLSGGSGDGAFMWADADIFPIVLNNGYEVIFTPRDADNYDYTGIELSKVIGISVAKAVPQMSEAPTAGKVRRGSALSEAKIRDGEFLAPDGSALSGSYSWKNADKILEKADEYTETVVFTPDDTDNFEPVELEVIVNAYIPSGLQAGGDTSKPKPEAPAEKPVDGTIAHDCSSLKFSDLDTTAWYHLDTDFVIENGIFKGMTENTFAPNGKLTRAMLVTVLYRLEGEPATNRSIPFADVDLGAYYGNAVIWAKQNGIVKGINENEFAPDVNITREQFAAIIYRYASFKGYDVTVGENTNILSYNDFASISEYAIPAMQYAVGIGLIKGRTESTLNPLETATRSEIAAILHRFIEANK